MKRKGVCYDVGRVMMGADWRPTFDSHMVHRELQIIKQDLHCDAVRICGLDLDRLMTATEDALKQGLEVWLSPEMWDKNQEETLDYLVKAAAAADSLRGDFPQQLVLSVGSELTLFMEGIAEGMNFFERMSHPAFWEQIKAGMHNKPLNAFLARANTAVRQVFHGNVTYISVPLETVDWSLFDFVGVDVYREVRIKDSYSDLIKRYFAHQSQSSSASLAAVPIRVPRMQAGGVGPSWMRVPCHCNCMASTCAMRACKHMNLLIC